ncbi:MAG TPA: hypothetical protein VKX17_23440 [Planctomycetota bacterium]|nr:hypothetical protein [Planctomycetota bacterium]
MEQINFDRSLNALKNRRPFQPFTVALVDGDRLEVDYPDALIVRDGCAVYIQSGGAPVIFDYDGVSQIIGDLAHSKNGS